MVNTITTKAVIYARYSSYKQDEQSIEGQMRVCMDYAKRENISIVGEYIDRAISGKTDNRPDLQRMIDDAKKKQFDYIIVYKLDRFARNRYDSAIYKQKLKEYDIKVVSATESIGNGDESVIMEALLEAMAEYYSKDLARKVKRGINESVIKGNSIGGHPLYGYKVVDKKFFVDEEKSKYIKYAFEQYATGTPMKKIVDTLNSKGATNRNGKPLSYNSFTRAFKNKKYIGIYEYEGEEYRDTYPPLIDEETFYKVQDRLKINARTPGANKAKVDYLLRGKIFCGHCGDNMVGESGTGKKGVTYNYYACSTKKKKHVCDKKNEKKDFIEWYVVEQTLAYVLVPDRMEYIADRIVEEYKKEFNVSKEEDIEKHIKKLESDLDNYFNVLSDAIKTGSQSMKDRANDKIALLELQKEDAETDLIKLKIANKIPYNKETILTWLQRFTTGNIMDDAFRKRIIDVFINSVYIYDDKVVIYYNIKDGKQISYLENKEALEDVRISEPMAHQSHPHKWVAFLLLPRNSTAALCFITIKHMLAAHEHKSVLN